MRMNAYTFAQLSPELFTALGHYRRRVFIELLGWNLASAGELEFDRFDVTDTVYLISQDDNGAIIGCARLLPTTRPYLLGSVFPQLVEDDALPCSADVWELSRFAALDFAHESRRRNGQFSAPLAVGLLRAALRYAAERGVKQLIAVTPVGVDTLLRRAGFPARRAGAVQTIDGRPLFACRIETQRSWMLASATELHEAEACC